MKGEFHFPAKVAIKNGSDEYPFMIDDYLLQTDDYRDKSDD